FPPLPRRRGLKSGTPPAVQAFDLILRFLAGPTRWRCAVNIMTKSGPFTLSPLPYDEGALSPVISSRTMTFHYGKHHKAYVDKLNELVLNTRFAAMPLDDVIMASWKEPGSREIFNNAAQAWNHTFFWACLTPHGGQPAGKLKDDINRDF